MTRKKEQLEEVIWQRFEIDGADGEFPTIKGVAQQADKINQNLRSYPRKILEREIKRLVDDGLDKHPGTVDHPVGSPSINSIGLLFTNLEMNNEGEVLFEARLVRTEAGKNLEAAIRAGVSVGISSRGYGSVKREKRDGVEVSVIGNDFRLEAFDAVTIPSVDTARITSIESLEDEDIDIEENEDIDLDEAKWTKKYINGLPDEAFAAIEDGGTKDDDGKTMPRSLRHLPHHDNTVKDPNEKDSIDTPHLKNALARCDQTDISDDLKAKAKKHLNMHAKQMGMNMEELETMDKIESLQADLEALKQEIESLKSQQNTDKLAMTESTNTLNGELEESKKALTEVEQKLAAADQKLSETEAAKVTLESEIDGVKTSLAEAEQKVVASNQELADAKESVKALKKAIDAVTEVILQKVDKGQFYRAGSLCNMADYMQYMHDSELQQSAEALGDVLNKMGEAIVPIAVKNYIYEKCRPEKFGRLLADKLAMICMTVEEVDARFESEKLNIEQEVGVVLPRGQVPGKEPTDDEDLRKARLI